MFFVAEMFLFAFENHGNGVIGEEIRFIDVAAHHFDGAVARLFHDESFFDAGKSGVGGKSVAKTVRAVHFGIEADGGRIAFHDEIDAFIGEAIGGHFAAFGNAAEKGTGRNAGGFHPIFDGRDAAHGRIGEVGDGDLLTQGRLVRFGMTNRDDKALPQEL